MHWGSSHGIYNLIVVFVCFDILFIVMPSADPWFSGNAPESQFRLRDRSSIII